MKLKTFKSIKELEKEIEAYEKITQKKEDKPENYPPHVVYYKILEDNSLLPGSSRGSSSKEKFNSHKTYKTLVNDLNYPKGPEIKNKVDTWYKDPLYGRVNTKNNLIYHNYWIFQNISGNPSKEICVFDFVADAFEFMKTIFASRKPSPDSQFLLELSAKAGNTSTIAPEDKYNSHIDSKFQQFLQEGGKQLENTKQIKNFNDFKKTFINYLKETQSTITYAGYFDTLNIDIYDSYLAFDVFDDGGFPTDNQKIDFLNDPNYFIYEYAARQAGFFVDQNKPWRLVANMKSKAMVVAMRRRLIITEALRKTEQPITNSFTQGGLLQSLLDFTESGPSLKEQLRILENKTKELKEKVTKEKKTKEEENKLSESDKETYNKTMAALLSESVSENINKSKVEKKLAKIIEPIEDFFVLDLQYILDFVDYFRKEISFNNSKVADYKNTLLSYISRKSDDINDTNNKNLTGNLKFKDLNIDEADENKLTRALIDILLIIEENKSVIEFIFRSLENQQKVLSFIDKKFITITPADTYKAAFSPVSDYAYFTYFPIKLQNYYEEFIAKYPTYNIFGKTERGNTKVFKNDREPLDLTEYKLSDNLVNDFYDLNVLIDYVDIRLYEESKEYSSSARESIINEVKEVYLRALEDYKAGKEYIEMRNISTKLIEAYTGFGYQKLKPIDVLAEAKKAPLYAENAYFEKSFFEPQIQLPRICLTLPARADILVEEDVCGKFDVSPDIVEEEIFGVGKCDITNILENLATLFKGTPVGGQAGITVVSYIKIAAENAKTKPQCDNLVPLVLEVAPENEKAGLSNLLEDKNISGNVKD